MECETEHQYKKQENLFLNVIITLTSYISNGGLNREPKHPYKRQ